MSIAIVLLFEASMVFSDYCIGGYGHSETDGYANLECKVVTEQVHSNAPIPVGIEDVFINNIEYADCTLYELGGSTDDFLVNNIALYYKCPGTAPPSTESVMAPE